MNLTPNYYFVKLTFFHNRYLYDKRESIIFDKKNGWLGDLKKYLENGSIRIIDYKQKDNIFTGEDFEFMVWKEGLNKDLQSFWKLIDK